MTLEEAHKQLLQALHNLYDAREAANIAGMVMEHTTGQRRIDRIIYKHAPVSEAVQQQLQEYTRQLLQHTPVQYVLHEAWFAGMPFYVDENVLIPRPETEELVEFVVCSLQFVVEEEDKEFVVSSSQFEVNKEDKRTELSVNEGGKTQIPITETSPTLAPTTNHKPQTTNLDLPTTNYKPQTTNLLDIGTGSGCIPVALKKRLPGWNVHALDVSAGALQVALKNAVQLGADITFYQADILDSAQWPYLPMFNVIVSNPPYIPHSEAAAMQPNVTAFEPHTALFVPDNDALLFYRAIGEFALQHLHPGGWLFFEIHESLGTEVCALLAQKGFTSIEIKRDMQGKQRMVKAANPPTKPPTP